MAHQPWFYHGIKKMSAEIILIQQAIARAVPLDVALYRGLLSPMEGGPYAKEAFLAATVRYSLEELLRTEGRNERKQALFLSINNYFKNEKKTPSAELNKLYQLSSKANVIEHEFQHCAALPLELRNAETGIEITFTKDPHGTLSLVGHAMFDHQDVGRQTMVQVLIAPDVLGVYDVLLAQTLLQQIEDGEFKKTMMSIIGTKLVLESYIFTT